MLKVDVIVLHRSCQLLSYCNAVSIGCMLYDFV